uniref:Uncharacterized protein AlNc14C255G9716 n=1 Tax=Albugo laibachii Nc14 TaxID=890382 RepID=F0WTP0_9STRA|nr:conserved hypothetical protein [Albugo laibachii Nc14]|eukprot:CCA24732.1 conserved hypothetical protein [Albugo laibachii Nc14]
MNGERHSNSIVSSDSLCESSEWVKCSLDSLESVLVEVENELRQLECSDSNIIRNANGIDIDRKTKRAFGRLTIRIGKITDIEDIIRQNPLLAHVKESLQLYLTATIGPIETCEKSMDRFKQTRAIQLQQNSQIVAWNDLIVFEGIKSKTADVKVVIFCKSKLLADYALGEIHISCKQYLDQKIHSSWFFVNSVIAGEKQRQSQSKLHLEVAFGYDAMLRHREILDRKRKKKRTLEETLQIYSENAPKVQSSSRHPAAFGTETAVSDLYIPGFKFTIDVHHPGAVQEAPIPDNGRVETPYGRGVVICYRKMSKIYVIQLDPHLSGQAPSYAYLKKNFVIDEPEYPILKVLSTVLTPYGLGQIVEIRKNDGVVEVQAPFGKMFVQKNDIRPPPKSVESMTMKELIHQAVSTTEKGNKLFKQSKLDTAVYMYVESLVYLERVKKENATHKQRAIALQTMIRCHLNIGACRLKMNAFEQARVSCTSAVNVLNVLSENRSSDVVTWMARLDISEQLLFSEWPAKAHFRRAQAYMKLHKYGDARDDLIAAIRLNPKDRSCRVLLEQVNVLYSEQKNNEKQTWGGIFESVGADDKGNEAKEQSEENDPFGSSDNSASETRPENLGATAATASDGLSDMFIKTLVSVSIFSVSAATFAFLAFRRKRV